MRVSKTPGSDGSSAAATPVSGYQGDQAQLGSASGSLSRSRSPEVSPNLKTLSVKCELRKIFFGGLITGPDRYSQMRLEWERLSSPLQSLLP